MKRSVAILGMHRSGTSTITRAINLLGAYLGEEKDLLPPNYENPEGFWERNDIIQIHDRLLDSLKRKWDTAAPLPDLWYLDQDVRPFREELKELIIQNFMQKPLWAWKDPRTCLLIDLWRHILDELGIGLSCVFIVRNPHDVAISLRKRNNFSSDRSMGIWFNYNITALRHISGISTVFVSYDRFLENSESELRRCAAGLGIEWPANDAQLMELLHSFLRKDLRHSQSDISALQEAPAPVKSLYALISDVVESPSLSTPSFFEQVERMYADFFSYARFYQPDLTTLWEVNSLIKEMHKQYGHIQLLMADRDHQIAARDQLLGERDRQMADRDHQIAARDQLLGERDLQMTERDQQLNEKGQQLNKKDQQLAEKDRQLNEKDRQLNEKVQQLNEKDQQLNEKDYQAADLQRQLAEQDRHLDVVLHTLSWRITAPLRWAYDKLVPFNTKRRLLITIVSGAFSQPKQFFRNMSMGNLRNFIHYLKTVEPSLLEKGVTEVLAGKVEEATNDVIKYNNHLLEILEKRPEEGLLVPRKEQVDIILPIYNAYEYTRTCLESVLRNSSNCRLILINDASTDKKIKDLLDSVKGVSEKNLEVVVMHNEKNLGFVKTVNRAQKYTNNHFVILNSDTEVPPGWLDRLFKPIFADEKHIASVTPFSNAAEICSFPDICKNNEIYENLNVDSLDRFFAIYGSQALIELPTGIGFCMAFNKYAVQKIGFYDEETFGRGYGEENDWSLRASNSGFKNVMITNLFVYHKHGGTFDSAEKTRLLRENLAIIANKYPGYFEEVHSFIRNDQLRDLRDTLAVIIDAQSETNKRCIAIIDHDQGGGANIYSSLLVEKLRQTGDTILHFRFNHQRSYLDLRYTSEGVKKEFMFRAASVEKVVEIMKILSVDLVLINQIASWPNPMGIVEKLYASGLPYIVFAHDFFVVCPNWFLVNDNYRFCEIPEDGDICISCLAKNRYAEHKYVYGDSLNEELSWRKVMHHFLLRAQKVICFSTSTMKYLMRTYNDLTNIEVIEHAIPDKHLFTWKQRQFNGRSQLNIAVIGSIGSSKGINIIQDLVHHPHFEKIPVNITVLGKTSLFPEGYVGSNGRLRIHGSYKREHLPALLEKYDISAVLIPSIWPETFSYTTSEALLLGYPVICFALGAQAERVSKYNAGLVVDDISAEGLMEAFEKMLKKPQIVEEMSFSSKKYTLISSEEGHFDSILDVINQKTVDCRNE